MNKNVYACFIDHEKAFDRVNHQRMIENLIKIAIPGRDIKFIRNLYWTQKAFVRLENGLSDEVMIKRGVRQGCVLSPALFNLYTEMIFRAIDDMDGVKIGGLNINNLRYADDTVLIAETPEQLQEIVNKVNEEGKLYGMKINAEKTKTMLVSKVMPSAKFHITVDNDIIKQVDSFVYLGQLLTEDAKCDKEILRRISIARGTFNKMKSTLINNHINLETRKRILKCYVWSTLFYGVETWTVTTTLEKRLEAFEMWTYRKMLKLSWTEKVKNEEVLQRMNEKRKLINILKDRKLKYFGHLIRLNNIYRTLLEGYIDGKRGRGRPRMSWYDNIKEWTGMRYERATRTAMDRDKWRATVSSNVERFGT